LQERLKV
jgi:predicted RNA binding protein YcfA (HicA-like mRNA interferase family)